MVTDFSTDYNRTREFPSIDKVIACTTKELNVSVNYLMHYRHGYNNEEKMLAIYACRKLGASKIAEIAQRFSYRSHGAISKTVSVVEKKLVGNSKMKRAYESIKKNIQVV